MDRVSGYEPENGCSSQPEGTNLYPYGVNETFFAPNEAVEGSSPSADANLGTCIDFSSIEDAIPLVNRDQTGWGDVLQSEILVARNFYGDVAELNIRATLSR